MSVILVFPFLKEAHWKNALRKRECLALGYLSYYLRKNGIDVDVLNAELLAMSLVDVVQRIATLNKVRNYTVIGISCSSQRAYPTCLELVEGLRCEGVKGHITVGGLFASLAHREIISQSNIDSVVRNEGERTLLELVKKVTECKSFDGILGLTYKKENNVVVNPSRPRQCCANFFPDREDLTIILKDVLAGNTYASMMASRGCPGSCSFCSVRQFNGSFRNRRPQKNVVDEMEYLIKRFGVRRFRFVDEVFLDKSISSKIWINDFCKEILSRKLFPVQLCIESRSDNVEKHIFRLLKESGLCEVFLGVESGVQAILDRYAKGITIKDNEKAIQILERLNCKIDLGFIMFDPLTTFDQLKANYLWLVKQGHFTKYNLYNKLNIYYGTPLAEILKEKKLLKKAAFYERGSYDYADQDTGRMASLIDHIKKTMANEDREMTEMILQFQKIKVNLLSCRRKRNTECFLHYLKNEVEETIATELEIWIDLMGEAFSVIERNEDPEYLFETARKKSEEITSQLKPLKNKMYSFNASIDTVSNVIEN